MLCGWKKNLRVGINSEVLEIWIGYGNFKIKTF